MAKAPPVSAPPPPPAAAPPAPAVATSPPTPPAAPQPPDAQPEGASAPPLPPPVPDAPPEPTSPPTGENTASNAGGGGDADSPQAEQAAQEATENGSAAEGGTTHAPNGGAYASDAKVPAYAEDVGDIKPNDPLRAGKLSAIAFKRGRRELKLGERRKSLNDAEWQAFLDAYARGVEQGEADDLNVEQRLARIERLMGVPTPGAVVYGEGE